MEPSPEDLSGKEGALNDSVFTSCLQEELITVFSFVNQNHSMLLQNLPQLCMASPCRRIPSESVVFQQSSSKPNRKILVLTDYSMNPSPIGWINSCFPLSCLFQINFHIIPLLWTHTSHLPNHNLAQMSQYSNLWQVS